jgi:nitrite reductase/ring-hydroxylating ferredoxin subunit/uncharacterized membrane protein
MNWQRVVDELVEHPWIESTAEAVQAAIADIYQAAGPAGQTVQNFLHGTWLGHPLHPVLTDLPVGAFTLALTLDALESVGGRPELAAGADAAVAFGIVSALGAASAGATDWYRLHRKPQRIGLIHALCNVGGTALYGVSLALRRTGARGAGRAFGLAGFGLLTAGAYLGGDLVYAQQIGVDHTTGMQEPQKFEPVMPEAQLVENVLRRVDVAGVPVVLARYEGQIYALADTCSHQGCSLAQGSLQDCSIRCSCHGSRFALGDGRVLDGPSTYWQPVYRVRIRNGHIEVGKRELEG